MNTKLWKELDDNYSEGISGGNATATISTTVYPEWDPITMGFDGDPYSLTKTDIVLQLAMGGPKSKGGIKVSNTLLKQPDQSSVTIGDLTYDQDGRSYYPVSYNISISPSGNRTLL